MAGLPVPQRPGALAWTNIRALPWAWILAFLCAGALRLLPASAYPLLDSGAVPGVEAGLQSSALEESFPGSAYFYAQDALSNQGARAIGSALTTRNNHIYQIDYGPAAASLAIVGATPADSARALQCLTNAIYYEAGSEPEEGQRAVAQVILNRMTSGRWPRTLCGVIYQGGEQADRRCQFSFSCDGSMARTPHAATWSRARRIAQRALAGEVFAPAGHATFYHTLAVHPPWADRMHPVAVIGAHIFYRLPADAGASATDRPQYDGREYAVPGPYAFSPPPADMPMPAPALPLDWAALPIMGAPSVKPISRSPSLGQTPPSAGLALAQDSAGPVTTDAALPPSTIRPEYRNTGRPLP